MKKRLVLYNIIIAVCALFIFLFFGIAVINSNNKKIVSQSIIDYTKIFANDFKENNDLDRFDDIIDINKNLRITIVDKNGTVIKDTEFENTENLDNHINRKEIQAALNNNSQIVIRKSDTKNEKYIYYAERIDFEDNYYFLRVAIPIQEINNYIYDYILILFGVLFLVLILSILLSNKIGKMLLSPFSMVKNSLQAINEGKFSQNIPAYDYDEINQMLVEINDISKKLEKNISDLTGEKNKLNFILDNINNGIFALDKNKALLLINLAAKEIFNAKTDLIGKNILYLTKNEKLISNINSSISNKQNILFELFMDKSIYLVSIRMLNKGWQTDKENEIIVVMFSDITNRKNNEKLRSDFFANASHELKTPLTSIKGFNELLQLRNKDENLNNYINQISKESERMLSLIEDMLKLSALENTKVKDVEEVDLRKISLEVIASLEPMIKEKNIKIEIIGEGIIKAEPKHIYELIKNLCENSVKYNVVDGSVSIVIIKKNGGIKLQVSDSGIGIDSIHQTRIFERFYRVEKSRSRSTGGTGLGLAIVKHICGLYDATLSIKSSLGKGTKISVKFYDIAE